VWRCVYQARAWISLLHPGGDPIHCWRGTVTNGTKIRDVAGTQHGAKVRHLMAP
jgi:hypothetical protein